MNFNRIKEYFKKLQQYGLDRAMILILLSIVIFMLIFISLILYGCTTKQTSIAYDYPKIKLPADPIDYTKILTDISSPDEVIKAWVSTATGYKEWNVIVKDQLKHQ